MRIIRSELLDQLTNAILELHPKEPTLVAIDGRSAAGKTTLANELALRVRTQGQPVLRSSLDDFHPPGHKYRSRARPYTPRSYYTEGYDYAIFRAFVLDPVRHGATRCRLAYWDSFADAPFPEDWAEIPRQVIAIIDGIFLFRPDLRQYWDYSIWLQINWDTMIERACTRDVAWVGSVEDVANRYRTFWIPAHRLYEAEDNPTRAATIIVDNQYPETPILLTSAAFDG